jgi:hypothetical protein
LSFKRVLEAHDAELALSEAIRRQSYNSSKRLRGVNGAPASGKKALDMHYIGCVGEIIVAKLLGLEDWLFIDEAPITGSPDLPGGIDVKTRPKHGYDLLIQRRDSPRKRYVLVTFQNEEAIVVGWLPGSEAMRDEYIKAYRQGRPCYCVPQAALRPIEELLEVIGLDRL